MQLIGMLDSPYVRRVAIAFHILELPFEHLPLSVFRSFDRFRAINPVVKAPTLVCGDGTVLMDSTLILDYAESLAAPRSLMPRGGHERRAALRSLGLALVACEKTVQFLYERTQRSPETRDESLAKRALGQLHAAYGELEATLAARADGLSFTQRIGLADLTTAVAWNFTVHKLPDVIAPEAYSRLKALSAWAEERPEFKAVPYDEEGVRIVSRR